LKIKILAYAQAIGVYLLRKVLLFDLAVFALIGLSFVIWDGFTWPALSERLVWSGIGIGMVAGILIFGQTVGGRNYGMPTYTAALSSNLIDWNIEIRKKINTQFDYRIQIFLIGVVVFLAGILVDLATKNLGG
jgi:hypothetical protein